MAHAVQKVVERCEVAKENGGIMGKKLFIHLVSLTFFFIKTLFHLKANYYNFKNEIEQSDAFEHISLLVHILKYLCMYVVEIIHICTYNVKFLI